MNTTTPPTITAVEVRDWKHADRTREPRAVLYGTNGLAAALTRQQAYDLARNLIDAAEKLPATGKQP